MALNKPVLTIKQQRVPLGPTWLVRTLETLHATGVRLVMASALAGKIFCQEPPKKDSRKVFSF